MHVLTPSGLEGEVRKLKGSEVNLLSDRRAIRSGKAIEELLRGCWTATTNPGPYSIDGDPDWLKVLVCDRFFTMVCIRIETYGPEFVFKTRCGETGRNGCGARFEWEIDLKRDLPYFELPDASRSKIKSGTNRFETELRTDDGLVSVAFKLATGADEVSMMKKASRKRRRGRKSDDSITTAIAERILSIDTGDSILKRTEKINDFLEGVDFDAQLELLGQMDEVDGGFDTKVEIECPECENVYEINLPFEGEAFWTPRKRSPSAASHTRKSARVARTMEEREETAES